MCKNNPFNMVHIAAPFSFLYEVSKVLYEIDVIQMTVYFIADSCCLNSRCDMHSAAG